MTEPLTPIDLDLRDFGFMPLEVVRLRDSDLAALATGDEFRAAVLLWCAAWHQVPAASLPNDDRLLAKFAGFGRDLKGWEKVRAEALRGFVECSDGRLYHPVIADIAIESGSKKKKQSNKTAKATEARIRKANERRNVQRDDDRDGPRNEVQGKGEEGKGEEGKGEEGKGEERTVLADKSAERETSTQGQLIPLPAKPPPKPRSGRTKPTITPEHRTDFERFWSECPVKNAKDRALPAFVEVITSGRATVDHLIERMIAFRREEEQKFLNGRYSVAWQYTVQPVRWLQDGHFNNTVATIAGAPAQRPMSPPAPVGRRDSAIAGLASRLTEADFDDGNR